MKFLFPLLTILILPLIGVIWLVKKVVIPFKRSSQNGMIRVKEEGKNVIYSPYFEFEQFLLETKLLVKVVIQLGNDGIQKGLEAPMSKKAESVSAKSLLYRESTLFLINQGETPLEVTPKYLEIDQEMISKLIDETQLIAAGHYYECEPHMAKDIRT
ncbi:MAG: hypothetical protein OEW60_07210, partial [Thiovulaceae bacterium]|nr:hypothetical protein [Sulfurimonadaceae bacterium]